MTTYSGPATLLLDDGSQFRVHVLLRSSDYLGVQRWWGTVGANHAPSSWQLGRVDSVRLRLPDGQEGAIDPTLSVALGGRVLQLTGCGPAPF